MIVYSQKIFYDFESEKSSAVREQDPDSSKYRPFTKLSSDKSVIPDRKSNFDKQPNRFIVYLLVSAPVDIRSALILNEKPVRLFLMTFWLSSNLSSPKSSFFLSRSKALHRGKNFLIFSAGYFLSIAKNSIPSSFTNMYL